MFVGPEYVGCPESMSNVEAGSKRTWKKVSPATVTRAPLPDRVNGGCTIETRTPGAFGADDRKVKATSSVQRAVARTATAVSSMVVDGGLLTVVSAPDELPHGAVGGGLVELVAVTVDDDVEDLGEDVDDTPVVVGMLSFPLPL